MRPVRGLAGSATRLVELEQLVRIGIRAADIGEIQYRDERFIEWRFATAPVDVAANRFLDCFGKIDLCVGLLGEPHGSDPTPSEEGCEEEKRQPERRDEKP